MNGSTQEKKIEGTEQNKGRVEGLGCLGVCN